MKMSDFKKGDMFLVKYDEEIYVEEYLGKQLNPETKVLGHKFLIHTPNYRKGDTFFVNDFSDYVGLCDSWKQIVDKDLYKSLFC